MDNRTAPSYDHSYLICILRDGELVFEDSLFADDARWIFFDQTAKEVASAGDIVQLIETSDGTVIEEKIAEGSSFEI